MKKFSRRLETFVCKVCGRNVLGNGYTNHCPGCLWSRHVDINTGDRSNKCKGLMEPVQITLERGAPIISHRCIRCFTIKNNKSSPMDDITSFLYLTNGHCFS